jgi:hypothetical protein
LFKQLSYKPFAIVILLSICSLPLSANTLDGRRYFSNELEISFLDETITITAISSEHRDFEGAYRYSLENLRDFTYLTVYFHTPIRFLALVSDELLYLYRGDFQDPFFAGWFENDDTNSYLAIGNAQNNWSSTSYYADGNEIYLPENLSIFKLFMPWVEGVEGLGVGEFVQARRINPFFIFSNGFVSYQYPNLFYDNARVKTISIEFIPSGSIWSFELEDTPNPQFIYIPFEDFEGPGEFKITIEEVYPGEKYNDTCLNFIN